MDVSDLVRSLNGRDEGAYFFVISMDDDYLYLADGKGRPIDRPKKKKRKHVEFAARLDFGAAEKIRSGEKLQNSELRRAIAAFTAGVGRTEGGL